MRKKSILVVLPQFRKTMLGSILPEDKVKALYLATRKNVQRDAKGHFIPKVKSDRFKLV